ncbi:MAG: RDD family protein [Actinobacteria bacterium]|nr:RDD family protein [Actinomycetota bacterium]
MPQPSGPRASFGTRFVAALIDGFIIVVVTTVLRLVFSNALAQLLNLVLGVAYFTYLEGSASGQTIGKRVMNIRVVDLATGMPIGPTRALIRYFGRFVSAVVIGIGYFWMLWDDERQTWHDKFANAAVVPTADFPVDAWPG